MLNFTKKVFGPPCRNSFIYCKFITSEVITLQWDRSVYVIVVNAAEICKK